MSGANKMQIGGTHYKTTYEHWDLVPDVGMGYFDGQATRYITRWRKKEGMKDLQKALHYVNKMIELRISHPAEYWPIRFHNDANFHARISRYVEANQLTDLERQIVIALAVGPGRYSLELIREWILMLMDSAEPMAVPVSDSNKYAERADD
jgi:hypothetical protein